MCGIRTHWEVHILHNIVMADGIDTHWFRQRMRSMRVYQKDIAKLIRRDRSVVSKIISGQQPIQIDQVPLFADALDVSVVEVLYRTGLWSNGRPKLAVAPVVNSVEAGTFADIHDVPPSQGNSGVLVEYGKPTVIALRVKGDSMNRVAAEGSLIVIDYSAKDLRDGEPGVFRRGGEATFKRYRRDDSGAWLEPDSTNQRHEKVFPTDDEPIQIVGRVIDIRPEYS
jgi:repressor LexA